MLFSMSRKVKLIFVHLQRNSELIDWSSSTLIIFSDHVTVTPRYFHVVLFLAAPVDKCGIALGLVEFLATRHDFIRCLYVSVIHSVSQQVMNF